MICSELKNVNIWSRNGHPLFKGKAENMPKYLNDFSILENHDGTYMIDAWVTIIYDDDGKKIVTIKEY